MLLFLYLDMYIGKKDCRQRCWTPTFVESSWSTWNLCQQQTKSVIVYSTNCWNDLCIGRADIHSNSNIPGNLCHSSEDVTKGRHAHILLRIDFKTDIFPSFSFFRSFSPSCSFCFLSLPFILSLFPSTYTLFLLLFYLLSFLFLPSLLSPILFLVFLFFLSFFLSHYFHFSSSFFLLSIFFLFFSSFSFSFYFFFFFFFIFLLFIFYSFLIIIFSSILLFVFVFSLNFHFLSSLFFFLSFIFPHSIVYLFIYKLFWWQFCGFYISFAFYPNDFLGQSILQSWNIGNLAETERKAHLDKAQTLKSIHFYYEFLQKLV